MDFLDTHQHLIYRQRLGYAWTSGIPALAEGDFTAADYRELAQSHGISGSLFMETGVDDADYQAEARFVAGLVGTEGILGQIASCRPETAAGFDAWLEECKDLHVKGFRRILHVMPDDLSASTSFRDNLRKIGRAGLAFDLCVLPRQHAVALNLLRACPDQPFVLDHCGVPDIAGGGFDAWAAGLRDLAQMPHLMVKLSGISAYCAPGTASAATLRPWVDHVIQCFGPARILWGSDWPVVNLGNGLPDWLSVTETLLAGLSPAERASIASENARRLYRL